MTSDFLALHRPGDPLLMPNAFDVGSAKVLATMDFSAIATTSGGFAATLGRRDGQVSREEAIAHAAALVAAVDVPVSADLENGFVDTPDEVAETIRMAREAGLAGCSIEDFTSRPDDPIYDAGLARERIAAAVEASGDMVLTARCENYLHDRPDLADTLARLQSFQDVGADVLFAPGMTSLDDITTVCREVDRPVNVVLNPATPAPAELAAAGVARISVGGAFTYVAYAGLVSAAEDLRAGTTAYFERVRPAREVFGRAFG